MHAAGGRTYAVQVWADVSDDLCVEHAYGAPMIAFLTDHPCRGMERVLATTTVGGRGVGFAQTTTSFTGTTRDPYYWTGRFVRLVTRDGTGNIDDLLREGYRLPAGPAHVPTPDAFDTVGQDAGVAVFDVWYLHGATPNNDAALVRMTRDIFLQY